MKPKEFNEVIKSRYSIRTFNDEQIPKELIESIIDAARWAPSAHNRQPWKFLVLESEAEKKRLNDAMSPGYAEAMRVAGMTDEAIEIRVKGREQQMTSAPVIIVPFFTSETMPEHEKDAERNAGEQVMGIQSVSMAGATLMLSAHAEGLRTVWMCAPLFMQEAVSKEFGYPVSWQAQGMVLVGFPKTSLVPERVRNTLEDIILYPEN